MQHIDYNLLYRWFVGLDMDDAVWDHSTFTKNRDRLLNEAVARAFFARVLGWARWKELVSSDHFSVDGTLIEAWASMKSFKARDGSSKPPEDGGRNPTVDFKGEERNNDAHVSSTDPEARNRRAANRGCATWPTFAIERQLNDTLPPDGSCQFNGGSGRLCRPRDYVEWCLWIRAKCRYIGDDAYF